MSRTLEPDFRTFHIQCLAEDYKEDTSANDSDFNVHELDNVSGSQSNCSQNVADFVAEMIQETSVNNTGLRENEFAALPVTQQYAGKFWMRRNKSLLP